MTLGVLKMSHTLMPSAIPATIAAPSAVDSDIEARTENNKINLPPQGGFFSR